MKTLNSCFILSLLWVACFFTSCETNDLKDDISKLENRVENLEALVNTVNENLVALQVFVEGGKTIQTYEEIPQSDGTITYKLTLSDGNVINLSQGKMGSVQYPPISIDEEGYWTIDGVRQEGGKAYGDNAPTPKFRVSQDGFWQVCLDGLGNDYTYVLDAGGNKVQARPDAEDGGNVHDFFEDVWVDGDTFYVKLSDGKGEFHLPIVEDLMAKIEKPGDGCWVEEDEEWMVPENGGSGTTKVQIKGEGHKYFVLAPIGWKAEISDLDNEGNGTLTVTSPAQGVGNGSRASADNTAEVVLQVNKGLYWAIDKIRVKAGVPMSMEDRYASGKDIIIGGMRINKATFGEAKKITEQDGGEIADGTCVYFVESGATLNWKTAKPVNSSKRLAIIVIGISEDRSAVVKGEGKDVYVNSQDNGCDPLFVLKNVTLDNNQNLQPQNGSNPVDFVIDNCEVNLSRALLNFQGKVLRNLLIMNSTVNLQGNINLCASYDGYSGFGTSETSIVFDNNVFYSSKEDARGELYTGNFGTAVLKNVTLTNNIFMNLNMRADGTLIKAGGVSDMECTKNVFYDYSRYKLEDHPAVLKLDEYPLVDKSKWEDNICYTDGTVNLIPIYAYEDKPDCIFTLNFKKPDTPMESIDPTKGSYVLKTKYQSYGPQNSQK